MQTVVSHVTRTIVSHVTQTAVRRAALHLRGRRERPTPHCVTSPVTLMRVPYLMHCHSIQEIGLCVRGGGAVQAAGLVVRPAWGVDVTVVVGGLRFSDRGLGFRV